MSAAVGCRLPWLPATFVLVLDFFLFATPLTTLPISIISTPTPASDRLLAPWRSEVGVSGVLYVLWCGSGRSGAGVAVQKT